MNAHIRTFVSYHLSVSLCYDVIVLLFNYYIIHNSINRHRDYGPEKNIVHFYTCQNSFIHKSQTLLNTRFLLWHLSHTRCILA